MATTQFSEVLDSFHSSFMDKTEIPPSLELVWLKKSIAEYSMEICPLEYNDELSEFSGVLDQYVVDTLATMMKIYYIERCMSKYNKIASIVGKDLSVNSGMSLSKYTKEELAIVKIELEERLSNLKPTAYN